VFSIMRGRTEVKRYALKPPRSGLSRKRFSAVARLGNAARPARGPVTEEHRPRINELADSRWGPSLTRSSDHLDGNDQPDFDPEPCDRILTSEPQDRFCPAWPRSSPLPERGKQTVICMLHNLGSKRWEPSGTRA
jgi:hypothetical protein